MKVHAWLVYHNKCTQSSDLLSLAQYLNFSQKLQLIPYTTVRKSRRGKWNCQKFRLLYRGGVQVIFRACKCIFISLLMHFYLSKDNTVLRYSVLSYLNLLFYYVTMPLMWNGITWDGKLVLFRCKNSKMEQRSVIFSDNECIFIHTNRDTVLKCSGFHCASFSFFFFNISIIDITNTYFIIVFNLNWYNNRNRDRNCNRNWFLCSSSCYVQRCVLVFFRFHLCTIPVHTKVYWKLWLYLQRVENSAPERG